MSHWLAVTEKSMFYSTTFVGNYPTVGWVDRHFGKRNDKYVNLQCVVFFSQCTKLEWGFVKSLVSFFFKIPPSCLLVSSLVNNSRTTGGKRILSLTFFTFIGVYSLWIDILIWFHIVYPQQLERWSEKERKWNFRDKLIQEHAKRTINFPVKHILLPAYMPRWRDALQNALSMHISIIVKGISLIPSSLTWVKCSGLLDIALLSFIIKL